MIYTALIGLIYLLLVSFVLLTALMYLVRLLKRPIK